MFPHISFYGGFLPHKNKFIAATLIEQIEQGSEATAYKEIIKHEPDHLLLDFQSSLKIQIRYLCLLSIETMFELIKALEPTQNPTNYTDKQIVDKLLSSKPREIIKFIQLFEQQDQVNVWMDRIVDNQRTVAQNLFYFNNNGVFQIPDNLDEVQSIVHLKSAVTKLAIEVSNRDEINAYKHGERIFPFITAIIVQNKRTKEVATFEAGKAFTFFSPNSKGDDPDDDGPSIHVNGMDYEADFDKIVAVSKLLQNIIAPRKCYFVDTKASPKMHYFTSDLF